MKKYYPVIIAILLLAFLSGCNKEPAVLTANQLPNPDFEQGRDPWYSIKPPNFTLSKKQVFSGEHSALLELRSDKEETGTKIGYLVQDIKLNEFPEFISGNYFVEDWVKGTDIQYLQFVVIVWRASNFPKVVPNYQIRYLLAGTDTDPFAISNAKFVYLDKDEPKTNQWVHFERNLAQDFKDLWGVVPEDFESIRVLFEVRYDGKKEGEGPVSADVYYDDLYLGPLYTPA